MSREIRWLRCRRCDQFGDLELSDWPIHELTEDCIEALALKIEQLEERLKKIEGLHAD